MKTKVKTESVEDILIIKNMVIHNMNVRKIGVLEAITKQGSLVVRNETLIYFIDQIIDSAEKAFGKIGQEN